ncbi:MAG: 40S ribosomal protein S3a/S1 [Candidatus Nanohaloarchaeota archaeon QJJ-7]|nr:40S ribosomal protein S3a/S1 [Candidatus Nanohaloarchaeota archaeon QJJ-7]
MAKAALQKDWYELVAPELFGREVVAETPAEEPEKVEGRNVKVDLEELLPDTDRYYMDVFLRVEDVEGSKAKTSIAGHDVSSEYISRMVSRRSDRIDAVEDVETKDGKNIRVKVVGVTIRKTSSSRVNAVRKRMREAIQEEAEGKDVEEFMDSIFEGRLQQKLRDVSQDIYPLRDVEVRKTEVQ